MRKIKIIGTFVIFFLSFVSHFMYEWFPNVVFSILFPVNESIWEHMKLIVTPVLIFSILEYCIYKRKGMDCSNFVLSYSVSIVLGIVGYLIVYIPIHYMFGHNLIFSIFLLLLTFMAIEFKSSWIMHWNKIKYGHVFGLGILLFAYVIFGYFTYFPVENDLFYDSVKKGYGLVK